MRRDYLYLGDLPVAVIAQGGAAAEVSADDPDATFMGTWPQQTSPSGYQGAGYRSHRANTGGAQ